MSPKQGRVQGGAGRKVAVLLLTALPKHRHPETSELGRPWCVLQSSISCFQASMAILDLTSDHPSIHTLDIRTATCDGLPAVHPLCLPRRPAAEPIFAAAIPS
ncbi:hypothetical protein PtA15_4A476 [Puccinia triticina]|uniref:Uncharacterized protein n=1 Tax=Puccinia triticina TaxID=208348 RepID=A0ABY7CG07_9BASI|nr:uncharacterized protein PtA15_4A476 [Puccinia triticina]WAQ84025.1 hypothetical protein PtA15_4A476 [Puccinia triticina]WAR54869.1 hypothetical protein PtB15_4B487 [Puccinia triticina]